MINQDLIALNGDLVDNNIIYHGAFLSRVNSKLNDPYADSVSLQLRSTSENGGDFLIIDDCGGLIQLSGSPSTDLCTVKYSKSITLIPNSYLTITTWNPSGFNLSSESDYTLETWMYLNKPYTNMGFLNKGSTFSFSISANSIAYSVGSLSVSINTIVPMSTWFHIAFTRNNTTYSIWLNGIQIHTTTYATTITHNFTNGIQVGSSTFEGFIENLRLTQACRYTSTFTPPLEIQPFYGEEGLNHVLDVYSNVITKTTGYTRWCPTTAPNQIPAYQFKMHSDNNINADGIVINHTDLNYKASDFTVEFLVYVTGYNSIWDWCKLYHNNNGSDAGSIEINMASQKFGYKIFTTDSSSNIEYVHSATITLNAWYHLAICRSGNTIRFFIDGVQVHSATLTVSLRDVTNEHSFGGFPQNSYAYAWGFYGYIGNILINKVAKYTADFTPNKSSVTTGASKNRGFYNYGCRLIGNSEINVPSSGYLIVPMQNALNLGFSDYVLDIWVKFNTVSTGHIVRCLDPSNYYTGIILSLEGGNVFGFWQFGSQQTGGNVIYGTTAVVANNWYHVSIGVSNGIMRLTVNGVTESTKTMSVDGIFKYPLRIMTGGNITFKNFYLQKRPYPTAYLGTFTPSTNVVIPIAYKVFNKIIQNSKIFNITRYYSMGTLDDHNSSNSLILNGASLSSTSLTPANNSLDGSLNLLDTSTTTIPIENWNGFQNFGIGFLLKIYSNTGTIFSKPNVLEVTFNFGVLTVTYGGLISLNYNLNQNEVYHILIRIDYYLALYVNGQLVQSKEVTGFNGIIDTSPQEGVLGGNGFIGVIDELMFSKNISAPKIKKLYTAFLEKIVCANPQSRAIRSMKKDSIIASLGKISGHTSIKGVPTQELVKIFTTKQNTLVATTLSDSVTGYYEFTNLNPSLKYFVISEDITTNRYNSLIKSDVYPTVIEHPYSKNLYLESAKVISFDSTIQPLKDLSGYQHSFTTTGSINTTDSNGIVFSGGYIKVLSTDKFDVRYTDSWELYIEFNVTGGLESRKCLTYCGGIQWSIFIVNATTMLFYTNNTNYNIIVPQIILNSWLSVRLNYYNGVLYFRFNDVLIYEQSISITAGLPLDLYIGSYGGGELFNGKIRKYYLINKPKHLTTFKN